MKPIPGNKLCELPLQFTTLTRLVHLNLGSNSIKAVPSNISNLMRYAARSIVIYESHITLIITECYSYHFATTQLKAGGFSRDL